MCAKTLICDANILIDYYEVDKLIISELCELFSLFVPDVVLDEVESLERDEAEELGITVIDTPLEMLADTSLKLPGCSLQDTICFCMARDNDWACATNDKALRRECLEAGIEVFRGLQLLLMLVENENLTKKRAQSIAKAISAINQQITSVILEDFEQRLSAL